jgi:hypothetical protein
VEAIETSVRWCTEAVRSTRAHALVLCTRPHTNTREYAVTCALSCCVHGRSTCLRHGVARLNSPSKSCGSGSTCATPRRPLTSAPSFGAPVRWVPSAQWALVCVCMPKCLGTDKPLAVGTGVCMYAQVPAHGEVPCSGHWCVYVCTNACARRSPLQWATVCVCMHKCLRTEKSLALVTETRTLPSRAPPPSPPHPSPHPVNGVCMYARMPAHGEVPCSSY